MKSTFFIIILLLLNLSLLKSQDEITFRSGDILKAKIVEVGTENISYKKFDNLSGPSYTVKKDQVFMIKYENGTKDVFTEEKPVVTNISAGGSAVIYFYRPSKMMGSVPDIIVGTAVPDEVIVKLRNGRWFRSEYVYTGQREFVTGIYSINKEKLNVSIEPGKTYYIRCSIMKGMGMQSQIEVVPEETGRKEMAVLKEQTQANK